MNKVMLMGRLTKDPEIRYSQDQMAIAGFSIAVDRRFGKDKTDFFDCSAFGKLAEFVEKYLQKGTKIVLAGRIENNNYTNRQGQKVYATVIVAEEIDFAESKNTQSEPAQSEPYIAHDYQPQAEAEVSPQGFVSSQPTYEQQSFMDVPANESELPFN